ncbi:MAG: hypothetical protein KH020_11560 [Clostridiales bacterium]|nr:hypothetical protein [Clostridiales bacterium]
MERKGDLKVQKNYKNLGLFQNLKAHEDKKWIIVMIKIYIFNPYLSYRNNEFCNRPKVKVF